MARRHHPLSLGESKRTAAAAADDDDEEEVPRESKGEWAFAAAAAAPPPVFVGDVKDDVDETEDTPEIPNLEAEKKANVRDLPPVALPRKDLIRLVTKEHAKYCQHLKDAIDLPYPHPIISVESVLDHWIHNGAEWNKEYTVKVGTMTLLDVMFNILSAGILASNPTIVKRFTGSGDPSIPHLLKTARTICNTWSQHMYSSIELQQFFEEAMYVQVFCLPNAKTPESIMEIVEELKRDPSLLPIENDMDVKDDLEDDDDDEHDEEYDVDISGNKPRTREAKMKDKKALNARRVAKRTNDKNKKLEKVVERRIMEAIEKATEVPQDYIDEMTLKNMKRKADMLITSFTATMSRVFFTIRLHQRVRGMKSIVPFVFPDAAMEGPVVKFNEWFALWVKKKPTEESRTAWVNLVFDAIMPMASDLKATRGTSITKETISSIEIYGDTWGQEKRDKVNRFLQQADFEYITTRKDRPGSELPHLLRLYAFSFEMVKKYKVDFRTDYLVLSSQMLEKYTTTVTRMLNIDRPACPIVIHSGFHYYLRYPNKWVYKCASIAHALLLWLRVMMVDFKCETEGGISIVGFIHQFFGSEVPVDLLPSKVDVIRTPDEIAAINAARLSGWDIPP